MADPGQETETGAESQPATRNKPGLFSLAVVGVVAMVSGAALALGARALMPEEERPPGPEQEAFQALDDNPEFIPFGEVVVNLDDGRLNRYLRLNVTLQVHADHVQEVTDLIEKRRVVLKNWLLSHLSDKDMEQIRGAVGQNRLRREIRDQFNTVLFPDGYDRIHDVLFEEFNVQ